MAKAKFERTKPHLNVGTIGHIDHGELPPLLSHDIQPSLTVKGLRQTIARKKIDHMLVFTGKEAVVAVFAFCYINDKVPFFHRSLYSFFHFST